MSKHKAKRIGNGLYIYRGFKIQRQPSEGLLGYARYVWEAEDEFGCGFTHASTLSYCKFQIDEELDKQR